MSEEWERSQKGYIQEQVPKECQLPNQVQTEERKPTDLPQTGRLKLFQSEWEKSLCRQNSLKLCQRIRNPFDFKTFSEQNSRFNPRIFNRVSFIKNRNRQIASERSNRTSGQSRTWVICEPLFHSSKVKRPKASCDQFEASKSDLYLKPMSVCGHVFSYRPSTKASSFVLQKNNSQ